MCRSGAALNLHVHSHVLALDGTYVDRGDHPVFEPASPPTSEEVLAVSSRVAERVAAYFIREGVIDAEGLIQEEGDPREEGPWPKSGWLLPDGHVVESTPPVGRSTTSAAAHRGFSIHAGVAIAGHDADGRARLVRHVSRPPFAEQQVQLCRDGRVAFRLGHPKPTGETHLFLDPLTFLRRVTSQIPPLGMNLVRYHGILAPAATRRPEAVRPAPCPTPVAIASPKQTVWFEQTEGSTTRSYVSYALRPRQRIEPAGSTPRAAPSSRAGRRRGLGGIPARRVVRVFEGCRGQRARRLRRSGPRPRVRTGP